MRKQPEKKKLSVREIAAKAGVSIATVSRVVNHSGNVAPETEVRVREVIRRSNYVPSMLGRSLKAQKSPAIGIIVPDISGEFYNVMVHKLQTRLQEKGYMTFFLNTAKSADIEKEYREWQSLLQASGWLVLDSAVDFGPENNVPTVYINRTGDPPNEKAACISTDSHLTGALAGRELMRCGCRNVAVLTSNNEKDVRPDGFLSAIKENEDAGVAVMLRYVNTHDVNARSGYLQMAATLAVMPGTDGVYCTADRFVPGVLQALSEAGRRVPEDVKVVGSDDTPIAAWFDGGFTTVRQEMDQLSEKAVEAILTLIRGEAVAPGSVVIPGRLVRRRTTLPCP